MDLVFSEHALARMEQRGIEHEWCYRVVESPARTEAQPNGWTQYWGYIAEADQYIRVVVRADGKTVHTTHPDRNFTRRMERGD